MNSILFDTVEIRGTTYIPRYAKHESAPERKISSADLAGEDGSVLISSKYGTKKIIIKGIITGTSQDNLELNIDTLQELFSRQEKNLDIEWNGSVRRYVATCKRLDFDRDHFNILFVPYEAEFVVSSGEGKATAETTALNATITGSGIDDFEMLGSKPAKPTIKLSPHAAGIRGLEFKNTDNGEKLIWTSPNFRPATGDYINFNCGTKKLYKFVQSENSVEVEDNFYGVFPKFKVGTNNIKITAGEITNQETGGLTSGNHLEIMTTTRYLAQSFMVPRTDTTFQGISLFLDKFGGPGNMTVEIQTDNAGKPSGTPVTNATFTITSDNVSTTAGWVNKNSANIFTLTANTKYWIVIKAAGVDGSKGYDVHTPSHASAANRYANGSAMYSDDSGSTWTAYDDGYGWSNWAFKVKFGGIFNDEGIITLIKYYKTYL
jgi:hypothetical protein